MTAASDHATPPGPPDTPTSPSWQRWLPGLGVARRYQSAWLKNDLVAGLVVTSLLVPQGMAYAELAGLPPVTGLYTTVLALLAYAMFGPSRVLVLGPDSALGPLIAASILPLIGADGDPARAIALASMLAIMMGGVCMLAGLAKLGSVAELLSKPVRIGYLNGIAIVVLVSQLPKLFGFSTDATGFVDELKAFAQGVRNGETNTVALTIGAACLVVILGFRRVAPKLPGVLVAVVGATVAVGVFDLTQYGISVVGTIPSGFPSPGIPRVGLSDVVPLLVASVGMAFVTLADASALSRAFALKYGDHVDPNQEIVALGTANVAAGLFQGFPVSASSSRTAVVDSTGAKTELVGVVGAVSVVALLLFANGLLQNMPSAALGAVVIAASFSLFDLATMRWLWRVRRSELYLCVAAIGGVVLIGVLGGIVFAIVLSLGNFVRRAWRPYAAMLGPLPGREGYHDVGRHPDDAEKVPGVLVIRFDAPIFFANAEHFGRTVWEYVGERNERDGRDGLGEVLTVILAAEPVTDIDTTGAEVLDDLVVDLDRAGIRLIIAEMRGPVKDHLQRYGVTHTIGDEDFFDTVEEAVAAATGTGIG